MGEKTSEAPTAPSPLHDRDVERLRAAARAVSDEDRFGGAFELVREAGAGGMGKVYEAIERATSRRVAIKVITGLAGPSERARFAAETEVLERLDHPAIVDYVAHGETIDGEPYLAMEWLVGESLSHRLDREKLSIAEAAILGERIADALDHAHRAGVVHRDLKPSNIFLVDAKASEAHLIDFGVAKQADRDLTHTGQMIGTPGYMAPEQVRGEKTVNASADLFALGCVLYKALTGKDAFEGAEVMEILARLLLEDPEPIEGVVVDLPPRFAHLIGSLLSKDPKRRLGDSSIACTELRAIRRALEDRDASALELKPDSVPTPVLASASTIRDALPVRRPRWMWLAGAAAVVVIGVLVALLVRGASKPPAVARCSEHSPDACEIACNTGDAAACHLYAAILHDNNRPELVNHEKARELDVKACELGENAACQSAAKSLINVAVLHTPDAATTHRLMDQGDKMYQLACDRDDFEACKLLGKQLSKGVGDLPPDPPRAFRLVIHACDRDHASACNQLMTMATDPNNGATEPMRTDARKSLAAACTRGVEGVKCP